jgi:hypothetical protein
MTFLIRSAVLALAVGACGPTYHLNDDIDTTWDFEITLSDFDSDLHAPYVRGTNTRIYATSTDDHPDFRGWHIETSDPAIFQLDASAVDSDGKGLSAQGTAVAEGIANLTLFDAGNVAVGHGVAEVLVPDAIELDAHGYLIMGRDTEAPVKDVRMIENGTATYLVRYFRNGRELHGNGVLTAAAPVGITATPRTTFFWEDREWLTLDGSTPGVSTIELLVDHVQVRSVPVTIVPETEIANVVLITESEDHHNDGDWLVALAQAYDGNGARIFGVDYTWDINGVQQVGDGDLYRYAFASGKYQTVRAKRGGHSDEVMIQSDHGYVDSSNNIGCTAGGGESLGGALAGLALCIVRRRRSSSANRS